MVRGLMKTKVKIIIYAIAGLVLILVGIFGGFDGGDITATGSGEKIVAIALGEAGTVGGDKYRQWYTGYADGEPWCATFVSWCAEQCGLIEQGVIPKFQGCDWGVSWFQERGLFRYTAYYGGQDYTPQTGDIIFFSGVHNKFDSTHVGLVQHVEGEYVVTIEGNTSNSVLARSYPMTSAYILGYATPSYPTSTGNLSGESNAEIAWNYFISMGCNEYAAAGILGNLEQESSGIVPTAVQGGGAPGRGIAQWELGSDRYNGLLNQAAAQGKEWSSIDAQLEYIWYELNGGDSTTVAILNRNYGGLSNFKHAESIEWATEVFCKSFERAGKPNMSARIEYANYYYNLFSSGKG